MKITIRHIAIAVMLIFVAVIIASSDLVYHVKAKVFAVMVLIVMGMFTRPVRKLLDPSYDDDQPNEPVVEHDIGPTEGDVPYADTPAFRRERALRAQHNPFFEEVRK